MTLVWLVKNLRRGQGKIFNPKQTHQPPKPDLCQNHPSHLKSQRVMPWNNFNPKYVLGGLGVLFLVLAYISSTPNILLLLRLGFEVPMQASSVFFAAKPKPFSTPIRVKSQLKTTTFGSNPSKSAETTMASPKWAQKTVVLPVQKRGCHLITPKLVKEIEHDLSGFKCGLAHFFLQHTSASLTINENYDTDVRDDTETFLNKIVPEGNSAPWKHTLEGPDDMPAHIKSSMFGCTLTVPITDGRLNMGTWQGIWLCEHRDHATPRKVVVTLNGV